MNDNDMVRGARLVRPAKGGLGTPGTGVWGKVIACDRDTGLATVGIYAAGIEDPLDPPALPEGSQEVTAWNGVEAWHRVDDIVLMMRISGTGLQYAIMDKIKGFAWEAPAEYSEDYTLAIDEDCCTPEEA